MTQSYVSKIDRRTTLKWLTAGLSAPGLISACSPSQPADAPTPVLGDPKPITGIPYGSDPDLLEALVTWERTMTSQQIQLVAALGDALLPQTDDLPAASTVGVPDFIDEWISSPYEQTQSDRQAFFALFEWLERETLSDAGTSFAAASIDQQSALLDRFAWKDRIEPGLEQQADAFDQFRNLAVSAYFASEQGSYWLGYRGNRPSAGDYAGPTDEALSHLNDALQTLGLQMPQGL
ncbi:MAG: gluconate 2-dehydrogenase subunit 3 family protein [Henriciella sp.]|nr:gluconate 2-dehydrogenase subunit 3 family protein [Henriciella sp.]